MNGERLREMLGILKHDLEQLDHGINTLYQTLVERETKRIAIIEAIRDIEEMLKNG